MRVAILEDDESQIELLSHWLRLAGHHAFPFSQGADLLRALGADRFDAVLLDWGVSDLSGVEVLRRIRTQLRSSVPVLFCTARAQEEDIVVGLKAGADDYLVKPMRRLELLARLEAVSRRAQERQVPPELLEVDVFRADLHARTIARDGRPVDVTAKDFDLAVLFLANIGRLLPRKQICERVWGAYTQVKSRTLDTHVSRLRSKLDLTPGYGWHLAAVYGCGYRLDQIDPLPDLARITGKSGGSGLTDRLTSDYAGI
ncbi:MAG: DNA-binding response regulator [Proteobacteria bacterium]|nr:MAG: DNA-binding response regulator [Pseudomonadota bacterium]